jgi:hypothetical protein
MGKRVALYFCVDVMSSNVTLSLSLNTIRFRRA